jgi:hypothetical protein
VDLEGIANDGLGYTVTISGPDRPSLKRRKWLKAPTMNLLFPRERSQRPSPITTRGLAIPLKTEVVIDESWRSPHGSHSGSRHDIEASDMTIDAAISHMTPKYLGDQSLMTPEPTKSPRP